MCRNRRDYDINTIDDTTINSDDINRYQKRADISIFCDEFIRIDTYLAFSPSKSAPLPPSSHARPLTTLSTTCPVAFSEELFIAIPHRDSPSLPLYPFLKKQFIRLFVFRFDVPRGLFRFLSIVLLLPPFPLPSLDVPVTFSSE